MIKIIPCFWKIEIDGRKTHSDINQIMIVIKTYIFSDSRSCLFCHADQGVTERRGDSLSKDFEV